MNDNPAISLYVFGDGDGWASSTTLSDGVIKFTFDDKYTSMIIVRSDVANSWDGTYKNQTEDITSIQLNKLYKANGFNNNTLLYTVEDYTEPVAAGYTVDFNTSIATSSHDFAVAAKWKHIVQDNDGSYVNYKWDAAYGVNETGGLLVYSQKVGSSSWDMANVYDLLVTPKVSGTIKLKVKVYENASSSTKAFVQLWSVNGSATEKDTQLKEFQTEIPGYQTGTGDWVELTYDVTEAQRIGIRAQYVYIDDFSADAIDTTPEAALVVSSVMNSDGQSGTNGTNPQFEQQADGNMKVVLKVTLSNTGDVDFVAGTTQNYTLTLAQASYTSGTKTYYEDASIAIPENIAAGKTKTFDVEFTIPYLSGYKYWYVRENVTGTTSSSYRYATSVAYESKFILREAGSTSTSDLTTAQAYGRISAEATRSFEIYNDGTAPLTIKSITLPDGFVSDNLPEIPTDGLVLNAKTASDAFNVTLPVTTMGDFSGNLTIEYVKYGDTDATPKTLAFSGTVLQEGIWFADFNGSTTSSTTGIYPEGSVVTSSTTLQFGSTGSYNAYDQYLKSYSSVGTLVMPKLTATAGAQLKYDAVKYQSGNSYYLKVYVSTDRETWGEPVATINNSDLETSGERYSQTLTFDEAGDYYVAFELLGVGLDNVIGLTKTAVAHDLYFKKTSLVAEAQTGKEIKPSVQVIPLTAETAEGYTVKYYVDGVAVAEGTAEAMEVSATSDKTFTISYTPTDEVTTEHDTYIAFEFIDGTVIATEHQTLKVTNEPKFLFVAASTSVSQYTTNLTTAQAFGKVNVVTESKSFKIYNQGTAPLNVTSIVAPEGFSVNKTEAVVAAGESEDIIVTFSAATPGEYAGNLVVTYTQDGAEPYELAFSGTMLDQTKWYANFNNATTDEAVWPAGSVYQSKVSASRSIYSAPYDYYITSSSTTGDNMFITPKLSGNAGDKLQFDAIAYNSSWYSSYIKVYLAKTREALTAEGAEPVLEIANSDLSKTEYKTFEVALPAAGEYYVGIALYDSPKVDELYGLSVVEVAHEWQIASSNIPVEAMQNVAATATVNILNLGLADEEADSYTVTAYLDGEAVATGEAVAIPMNHKLNDAGTQLSVNILSTKTGEFPVYLEVKAGDYSVTTETVNVTFAEEVFVSDAIEIGSGTTTSTSYAPIDFYNFESARTSDILYTKDQLTTFGLKDGDRIITLAFKGTASSAKTISKSSLKAWVALSTGDITYNSPDKTAMTEVTVYNAGEMAFVAGTNMVTINLPEAITYDGTSDLRIYLEGGGNSEYVGLNFAYDTNYSNMKWSNATSMKYNPLLYVTLEATAPVLAGTVKTSAGEGIANATITLKAENGVEYSGTTAADGTYSFDVIQAGLDFTATVEAASYLKRQFALNMNGASATSDVTMYTQFGLVGTLPGLSESTDVVLEATEDPNIFTAEINNVEVTAGDYWYKLRADGDWKSNLTNGYQLPDGDFDSFSWNFSVSGTYNFKFTFDWTNHTLTFERPFTLAENADGVVALNWVDVTVEREFKAGWNAVVLPFGLENDEFVAAFGENSEVAVYDGDTNDNGAVTVKFKKQSTEYKWIEAGKPVLIWLENAVSGLKFTKDISAELTPTKGTTFDFVGTYTSVTAAAGDYFIKDGKFVKATSNNTVLPFRSYLKLKDGQEARSLTFVIDDQTTTQVIDGLVVDGQKSVEGVYNMQGQKVQNMNRKGLYIINGKKVMVK